MDFVEKIYKKLQEEYDKYLEEIVTELKLVELSNDSIPEFLGKVAYDIGVRRDILYLFEYGNIEITEDTYNKCIKIDNLLEAIFCEFENLSSPNYMDTIADAFDKI